ncbi:MAG: pyruvate dehydrogenase (acetyl-transferring) E1 component subunit alpha [Deltaproteobacteria bacterium]|nr:pyruvate dehydrogenase (acetyl-transferring) E1 component subunit alpha [Deltaproteobacteria bacterium]
MLRQMILVRLFEERCAEVYGQQKIRGFLHLYVGEEAVAVGAIRALDDDDSIVATYREHGHAIVRGVPLGAVMAEMYGRQNGCARGRGGSMHLFDVSRRFFGGYAIVGGGLPIAVGLALADQMNARTRVTACFFGDGATDEGEFHESLNLAALWRLPVLFLCENNQYAMGTALRRHASDPAIVHMAQAHGIPSRHVDGMDVFEVLDATREAAAAIRRGEGPRFLELQTYRFRAHSMYDAEKYRDREEVARWKERDPIAFATRKLDGAYGLATAEVEALRAAAAEEVEASVREADAGTLEPVEDLRRDLYVRDVG